MADNHNLSTKQEPVETSCASGVCEIKYSDSWNPIAIRKTNSIVRTVIEQREKAAVDSTARS